MPAVVATVRKRENDSMKEGDIAPDLQGRGSVGERVSVSASLTAAAQSEILPHRGAGPATQADFAAAQTEGFGNVQQGAFRLRGLVGWRGKGQVTDEFQLARTSRLDPPVLERAAVPEILDGHRRSDLADRAINPFFKLARLLSKVQSIPVVLVLTKPLRRSIQASRRRCRRNPGLTAECGLG